MNTLRIVFCVLFLIAILGCEEPDIVRTNDAIKNNTKTDDTALPLIKQEEESALPAKPQQWPPRDEGEESEKENKEDSEGRDNTTAIENSHPQQTGAQTDAQPGNQSTNAQASGPQNTSKKQTTPVISSDTQSSDTPPAPTPKKEVSSQEMSAELKALIDLPDKRVQSYEFYYAPPPANLMRDRWYIKENRIVIKLFEENFVKPSEYYDTIYIDTVNKTAVGYCEGTRLGRCLDWEKQYLLNYNQIMIKTPYQWVKEIPYGSIQGSEMLWGRESARVYYEVNNAAYKIWLDTYSGLPIRVVIKKPGKDEEKFEFRNLAINSVRDEQMYHQVRKVSISR